MDDAGFGRIRSKGDQALFGGRSTQEMKEKRGVSYKRPLADFLDRKSTRLNSSHKTLISYAVFCLKKKKKKRINIYKTEMK